MEPTPTLTVQRIPDARADYLRLAGDLDASFSAAQIGELQHPTVLDLQDVRSINSQGVQSWCEFVKQLRAGLPVFLVNVPLCIADQMLYVPNFAGPTEIVSFAVIANCPSCHHDQKQVIDLLAQNASAALLPDTCAHCSTTLTLPDIDLAGLAQRHRARSLPPELVNLLSVLGVYRQSAPSQSTLAVQKLVDGNANLLRMSGTLDERFRARRMLDGLEGTLLLETGQLEVTQSGLARFAELLEEAVKACSPVVMVNLPYGVLSLGQGAVNLGAAIVHSLVVPCYCDACDEIRQLSIRGETLLQPAPTGMCPRCGRAAGMITGMVSIDRIRPQLRPIPPQLTGIIGRFDEIFSAAVVEAKLTTTVGSKIGGALPQRIGPYKIVRGIARGGMADIFLAAREDGFSKPVALKLLRREVLLQARISVAMFLREARLNAKLNHPNIVQVFDVNEADGNLYIVMEYLEGQALWRLFRHWGRPFPPRIAIRIMQQVLAALRHAHTARDSDGKPLAIVHRDVSPSNVVVCPDGNVKLIDFGIAIAGPNQDVFAGNPSWMSPEQFSGGALDGRSDLFSVATVLHELLAGQQLFTGKSVQMIGHKVIAGPTAPPPGIPDSLVQVLKRAHQRDPDARYQNAAEFSDALRRVTDELGGEASEHDVRAFVADVISRPSARPSTASSELGDTPPQYDQRAGQSPPPSEARPNTSGVVPYHQTMPKVEPLLANPKPLTPAPAPEPTGLTPATRRLFAVAIVVLALTAAALFFWR